MKTTILAICKQYGLAISNQVAWYEFEDMPSAIGLKDKSNTMRIFDTKTLIMIDIYEDND